MKKNTPRLHLVRTMSEALHLTRTAERILVSLARAGKFMPVKDLVKSVRMSERSVRTHLSLLMRRGLLQRRGVPRRSKKTAYEYSLRPVQEMLDAARADFAMTIRRIESVVKKLGSPKTNPRNA